MDNRVLTYSLPTTSKRGAALPRTAVAIGGFLGLLLANMAAASPPTRSTIKDWIFANYGD